MDDAIVFGNGKSRLLFDFDSLHAQYVTYGCNGFYRDHTPDYLICVDWPMIVELLDNKAHMHSKLFTQNGNKAHDKLIEEYNLNLLPIVSESLDSGTFAVLLATQNHHKVIYIVGFDYHNGKNNNVYAGTTGYHHNSHEHPQSTDRIWQGRLRKIITNNKDTTYVRVKASDVTLYSDFYEMKNYTEITPEQFKEIYNGF